MGKSTLDVLAMPADLGLDCACRYRVYSDCNVVSSSTNTSVLPLLSSSVYHSV